MVESKAAVAESSTTVQNVALLGDFNVDGTVDDSDIDLLCAAIRTSDVSFDLTGDGNTNQDDLDFMVETILGTTYGDANLDGIFNPTDFIQVFQAGQYEDGEPGNSGWAAGDWNCDAEFDSSDLIVAFQAGGFVAAAVQAIDRAFAEISVPPHPSERAQMIEPTLGPRLWRHSTRRRIGRSCFVSSVETDRLFARVGSTMESSDFPSAYMLVVPWGDENAGIWAFCGTPFCCAS